jgi:hypothetical protein
MLYKLRVSILSKVPMSLIVMKFGGTSVGSAERIRQAATIVQHQAQQGHEVVVVVSALSKVTDLILNLLNSARLGNGKQMEEGCSNFDATPAGSLGTLPGRLQKSAGTEVEATLQHRGILFGSSVGFGNTPGHGYGAAAV